MKRKAQRLVHHAAKNKPQSSGLLVVWSQPWARGPKPAVKTAAPGNMKAEKVKGEQLCLRGRETEKRREQTMKKEGEKGDVGSSDPALCAIVVSTRGQNLVFGVGQCFESPRQKKTFGFLCQGGISELTKEKEKEKEKGEEERERKRSGQERKRRGRGEQHKTSRKKKQATK